MVERVEDTASEIMGHRSQHLYSRATVRLLLAPTFPSCHDALLSLLSIYDIRFLKFVDSI